MLQLAQSEGRGRGGSPSLILLLIWYWVLDSDRAGEEGSVVSQSEAPGAVTPRSLARVVSSPSASASATAACSCSLLLMAVTSCCTKGLTWCC